MAIDIGSAATDRASEIDGSDYTNIDLANPANASGTLTTLEFFFHNKTAVAVKVATFYLYDGEYYSRDSYSVGNIAYGSKQTITNVDLTVVAADFIGLTYTAGNLSRDTTGGSGVLYKYGDHTAPGTHTTYTLLADDAISLYGSAAGGANFYGDELNFTPPSSGAQYAGNERSFTPPAKAPEIERSFITLAEPEEIELSETMVNASGYSILRNSLSIETRIEERSTASFTVIDLEENDDLVEGYPVALYDMDPETIILEDDFEWGEDEDPITDSGGDITWIRTVPGTCKVEIDTAQKYAGTCSLGLYRDGTNWPDCYMALEAASNTYSIKVRARRDKDAGWGVQHGDGTYAIRIGTGADGVMFYYNHAGKWVALGVTHPDDTWWLIKVSNIDFATGYCDIWVEGVLLGRFEMFTTTNYKNIVRFSIYTNSAVTGWVWYDNFQVLSTVPVKLFGGIVKTLESYRAAPGGGLLHDVTCVDYHYKADKRRVAKSYENKTAGYIVADLWLYYLADEGVTVGEIQAGPLVEEMVVNYSTVADALDTLATQSGFIWYIDPYCALHFVSRDTNTSPWRFVSLRALSEPVPKLSRGNDQYRNRQYLKGASVTDEQTETFSGDSQTQSYTCGFPLAKVPTIKVDGASKTVGIKGVDTAKDFYWSKGDPVITTDTPVASGSTLTVTYRGQYAVMVISQNIDEISRRAALENGGTGYYEDVSEDNSTTTIAAVWQKANALLAKYCADGRRFTYETEMSGLAPGQLQHITYPILGLDDDFLIEAVDIRREYEGYIYSVTAIQGPEEGSWTRLFKNLSNQIKLISDRINIGIDETLIIAEDVAEWFGMEEDVSETPYACPLIGSSTVCGSTMIVC